VRSAAAWPAPAREKGQTRGTGFLGASLRDRAKPDDNAWYLAQWQAEVRVVMEKSAHRHTWIAAGVPVIVLRFAEIAYPQGLALKHARLLIKRGYPLGGRRRDDRVASRRSPPRLGGRALRLGDGGCLVAAVANRLGRGTLRPVPLQ
jgi:hypothetical protein